MCGAKTADAALFFFCLSSQKGPTCDKAWTRTLLNKLCPRHQASVPPRHRSSLESAAKKSHADLKADLSSQSRHVELFLSPFLIEKIRLFKGVCEIAKKCRFFRRVSSVGPKNKINGVPHGPWGVPSVVPREGPLRRKGCRVFLCGPLWSLRTSGGRGTAKDPLRSSPVKTERTSLRPSGCPQRTHARPHTW